MKKRINRAVASLAVAAVCTFGATSQASALDLLDELLGSDKYVDAVGCGCAQKKGGHVQRCGSGCGGKGIAGHAQRSGHKAPAGHVQHAGIKGGKKGGNAKKGSYHAELCEKIKAKVAELKCKLTAHHGKGSKGKGSKGDSVVDYGAAGSMMVPAPSINQGYQSVPVPPNPDPST